MMDDESIWEFCAREGIVVIPLQIYQKWGADGNIHCEDYLGVRFIALYSSFSKVVVSPGDFYYQIEESAADPNRIAETPWGAVEKLLGKNFR